MAESQLNRPRAQASTPDYAWSRACFVSSQHRLASGDFLVPVIAAHAAHQGLHRLTVDNRRTRGRVAAGMESCPFAQLRVDLDPGSIEPPLAVIPIHGRPWT